MDPVGIDDQQLEVVEREIEGHSFATAEARWAYERARRLRIVLRLIGAGLFLVIFGWGMYRLGGGGKDHGDAVGPPAKAGKKTVRIEPVGSPDAKIKLIAIVPSGSDCHEGIVDFIRETAKAHPREIRAEVKNMEEYSESELSRIAGSTCAAVLVNGKAEFDVTVNGKTRHISLVGTVPTHYTLGDLGLIITDLYRKYYGEPDGPIVKVPKGQEPTNRERIGSAADQGTAAKNPPAGPIKPEELLLPSFPSPKKAEDAPRKAAGADGADASGKQDR